MDGGIVWRGYVRGNPLFTLGLTDQARTAIGDDLRARVARQGIAALRSSVEVTRNFALHASQHLARVATRLAWAPVLSDLGVREDELGDYPELYDPVWQALAGLGRPPIIHNGERRFLATFLREGGLPAFIGDIAALVVDRATEIGWDALRDEGARTWVVGRVQQSATGSARRLLDSAEGRLALADFLSDAARARAALVDAGCDLRSLSSPESVRQALRASNIDLPSVANQTLLLAVLGSFTSQSNPIAAQADPLRLVSLLVQNRVELTLRVALDALDLAAVLPGSVNQATITAERCRPPSHRLERDGARFVGAGSSQSIIDLPRVGPRGDTVVDVRFTGSGGVVNVVPLGVLEWPEGDVLWFDSKGELLLEQREVLQAGESFTVVTWGSAALRADGDVQVQDIRPPQGATQAYAVHARGTGAVIVEQDGDVSRIECQDRRLDVTVLHRPLSEAVLATRMVRALPDVVVADGVEVDVFARTAGDAADRLVRRGARGRIALSAEPALRQMAGTVRVRLVASEGRLWSASWSVWPRGFEVSSSAGRVLVRAAGAKLVHAEPGRVERVNDNVVITPPPDTDRVALFVTLPSGERLALKVTVNRSPVRLRADGTTNTALPLDGTTQLTERQIYAGACLELAAHAGAKLTVANRLGDAILQIVQPSDRLVVLPLLELAKYLGRMAESPMSFVARVDELGEYTFKVHLPRLCRPEARLVDAVMEFDYELDDLDVPENPALAMFPVRPATAEPAIVRCEFAKVAEGKYVARLDPRNAPTLQGRYITFLVDRRRDEVRPMSGARLISIPLSLEELPCPAAVTGLDQALWTGNRQGMADEINAMVRRPELRAFLGAFAATVQDRARYGLEFFRLYETVARHCPWLLLAAWLNLPVRERDAWLALWPQQIRGFTWLYFKKSDAALLSRALPQRSNEERMALVSAADRAWRLPKAIEYLLCEALFAGESIGPIASVRTVETNSMRARAGSWGAYCLPQSVAGRRWLVGVQLDAEQEQMVEESFASQVLYGKRARAIRHLFRARTTPQYAPQLRPPDTPVALRILESIDRDWHAMDSSPLTVQIHGLEREIAIGALLLGDHRDGRRHLNVAGFRHVLTLEACSVDLLDYWLIATDLIRNEKS